MLLRGPFPARSAPTQAVLGLCLLALALGRASDARAQSGDCVVRAALAVEDDDGPRLGDLIARCGDIEVRGDSGRWLAGETEEAGPTLRVEGHPAVAAVAGATLESDTLSIDAGSLQAPEGCLHIDAPLGPRCCGREVSARDGVWRLVDATCTRDEDAAGFRSSSLTWDGSSLRLSDATLGSPLALPWRTPTWIRLAAPPACYLRSPATATTAASASARTFTASVAGGRSDPRPVHRVAPAVGAVGTLRLARAGRLRDRPRRSSL